MTKLGYTVLIGIILLGGYFLLPDKDAQDANALPGSELHVEAPPVVNYTHEPRVIEDGETFAYIMEDFDITYADALAIFESSKDVFDFASIKVGKEFVLVKADGNPIRIEYEPGTEYVVTIDLEDNYRVEKKEIEYDVEITTADLTIDSSMYVDGIAAGMSEELIIEFANIFAWEIDFATQVQKGDHVKIVYEKRYRDGKDAGFDNILAGEFINVGESIKGYRFVHADGKAGYYNDDGESLVRPFLKAPLSYSRITSGFTYARFHPVLNATTPHRAIDYAAPIGTPIFSVADGIVRQASWNGGYGNFVSIRHNERFTTQYAHLVSYAKGIRSGTRVSQGEVIGYVGSTGFSTGPHLHYEVLANGTKVNPLEVEFPKGDPIGEDLKDAFFSERDRLNALF